MSNREETAPSADAVENSSALEFLRQRYYAIVIGVVMAFMFWTRFQAYDRFTGDGVALQGVDSWYHWRTTEWTVENYPGVIGVDPFTAFPDGHLPGQFGTLFDFIVATVAMVIGLGDPGTSDIMLAALITVPALAALVAIPVFVIGRRLGGTIGGITGILLLALAPGTFMFRSTTGQFQHHVAEVLFMAIAVVAMMAAVRSGEVDRPIYELVRAKEWDELKRPAIYSALAGVATLLYILTWPPGVVLVGIFGLFFVVQLSIDFVRGRSPDHLAFVGVVSMVVLAVGVLPFLQESGFSATGLDYFQPTFPLLVAAGCLFMAGLARLWNEYEIDRRGYPAAIAGSIVVAIGALALILPDVYSTLMGNLSGRLVPFGHSPSALTVSEVQPPDDYTSHVFDEFGAAFYTMLAGLALLVTRPFFGREYRAEYTLIVVWSLVLISMSATQVRFSYYLVLAVAVANAVFVADVARLFDLDVRGGIDSLRSIQTYQVIVVFMVLMLLFMPLLPPIADSDDGETAWGQGERIQPHHEAMIWEESNEWMAENTPEPGDWGEHERADELDYYGSYEFGPDGTYDYPEGAYGVMSWWDYGHLITTQGERMPHSNPFQANARSSSAFLTAESEERGELILDAIAAGEDPRGVDTHSDEDLEAMAEDAGHEEMRYVMIDSAMAGGKFHAISEWTGPDYDYYTTPEDADGPLTADDLENASDELPYFDTMLAQLYFDDADGMEHYRVVHENERDGQAGFVSYAEVFDEEAYAQQLGEEQVQQFTNLGYEDGDVLYVNEDGDLAPHGEGEPSIQVNHQVAGQEFFQLQQNPTFEVFDMQTASVVKTYERVEGATLTGQVDDDEDLLEENAAVTVDVDLETNADRNVTYTQEADVADDGSFEVTVPYATNDELGVDDGYTDSDVLATGQYNVSVGELGEEGYQAQTEVPETDVVEGNELTVDGFEVTELEDEDELEDDDEEEDLENGDGEDGDGNETDDDNDTAAETNDE